MAVQQDLAHISPSTSMDDNPKPTTIFRSSNEQGNLFCINASHVCEADNATYVQIAKENIYLKPEHIVIEACNTSHIRRR